MASRQVKVVISAVDKPKKVRKAVVFWVMTYCRLVGGYHCCCGTYSIPFIVRFKSLPPLVSTYQIATCHNPEDHNMNVHCSENLKS
jgi:hypothetical protein